MKKILLIGELGESLRGVSDCLASEFQVQVCSKDIANIPVMARIMKPDMFMLYHSGMEEVSPDVFEWYKNMYNYIPFLGVVTNEERKNYSEYYDKPEFHVVIRPITKKDLLATCHKILGDYVEEKTENTQPEKTRTKDKKVMVVDDSAIMLRSMKSILERHYKICLAKSGEKALKMIPEEQPDVILLDYEMEGMDGKATFEIIRSDERMKHIPVIFLTGVSEREKICSVLKSRPNGYILKPPDEQLILDTIEKALNEVQAT